MALSDLQVFSEYTYAAMTEVLDQQIELFNAASRNTIQLQPAAHQGDFSEIAFFKKISGLVRRRDAYGTGDLTAKDMSHLLDTMVKVAAGTNPVNIPPGQFKWIQQNPKDAGAAMGQQLAGDSMADMLNTSIGVARVALANVAGLTHDITGESVKTANARSLVKAAGKFGDRYADVAAWVIHSVPLHDIFDSNLANATSLFKYETVAVVADPFGRVYICTDSAGLKTAGIPDVYWTLGLTPGAVHVHPNNDFTEVTVPVVGKENINQVFQAEWSFQLGIKGFSWDKANGGKSPADAALMTATNWDKYATSLKDCAGVVLKSN